MGGPLRKLVAAAVCVALPASLLFVACAIDEGGLGSPDGFAPDVSNDGLVVQDVTPVDHYIPPTCAELDASCVPAFDRDAWVPVAVQVNPSAPCPEDFATYDLITAPSLDPLGCACGACTPLGSYACGGALTIGVSVGNTTCSPDTIFNSAATCVNLSKLFDGGVVSVSVPPPNLAGSVGCASNVVGSGGTSGTPVRACRPTLCTSDYCGIKGKGFGLCILYNGPDAGCPTGFQPLPQSSPPGQVDVDANVASACAACGCNMDPASCTATFKTYDVPDCGTTTATNTFGADGGCDNNGSFAVRSIAYLPDPTPVPSCYTTTPLGNGFAQFVGPSTVCCAP